MGVFTSVFAQKICINLVSGLDEYADGRRTLKGEDRHPFCLGGGTGRGVGGLSEVSTPKSGHAFHTKKIPPDDCIYFCYFG